MFGKEKIVISEIQAVVHVKAVPSESTRVRFGSQMPRYELVYKLSGECFTTFNGKVMHNLPGTAELLPKCEHSDYTVDYVDYGECIDIYFDTESAISSEAVFFDVTENKRLEELFKRMYFLWVSRKDCYEYKCMSIMYEILFELSKKSSDYIPKNKYDLIEKGVDYLREHCLDKTIDYYEPARICKVSYTYFKRLFISRFGMPPIKYVTKLKLEYSLDLVSSKRYSVGEIAQMCGFDSVYYFSKKFKEAYGVSPTNYKF